MQAPSLNLSASFQRLYGDPAVFASFSQFLPISFARVLPFQADDAVVDDPRLLFAEEVHLLEQSDETRRQVVEAFFHCGLITETESANVQSVIDFYDADFFEFMGLVYANAKMFRCALRWYRELIRKLENENIESRSDYEGVYASVGYCLYSLGLFEEAIAWSKSCLGPRQLTDIVCRALITYEAQVGGGAIQAIERVGPRVRYYASAFDATFASQATERLKSAVKGFAPFQEMYLDWISPDSPTPVPWAFGYPFQVEFDGGSLVRHKMNLIFATCGRADALIARGYVQEAKRLLQEASLMEPDAGCIRERLEALR